MKKPLALFSLVLLVLATSAVAQSDRHIKAPLEPNGNSGVGGFVQLVQLPEGANLIVEATGLRPGQVYTSFYYESADCSEPADKLGSFTANDEGHGTVRGKIDEDVDEVGSVSVRLGPDYGELQACAKVH
jgi:hypothetical protein